MKNLAYIALLIFSAAALSAALYVKHDKKTHASVIGTVDAVTLFSQSREFVTIENARYDLFSKTFPERSFPASQTKSSKYAQALAERQALFSHFSTEESAATVHNDTGEAQRLLDTERSSVATSYQQRLESLYHDISSQPPPDLSQIRFDLMNLELKLNVLSRDPLVMSATRLNSLESQASEYRNLIARTNQDHIARSAADFSAGAEKLRAELSAQLSLLEEQYASSVAASASNAQAVASAEITSQRNHIDSIRREIASLTFPSTLSQHNLKHANNQTKQSFATIESKHRKEFYRRLQRKTPAIAASKKIDTVVISPWPTCGRNSRDLTRDLAQAMFFGSQHKRGTHNDTSKFTSDGDTNAR